MSNPYDPNAGQYPRGDGGFGGGSYPANPYGQGGQEKQGTDPVSIVGFILSLTGCLSIVGAILGFVGLSRTKPGRKKGRWAAISAIIIGILGTLVAAGITVLVVFVVGSVVTPENAEVGQCVDLSESDDDAVGLTKKECGEDHDAEIVATGEARDVPDADLEAGIDAVEVCRQLSEEGDFEAVAGYSEQAELEFSVILEDPDNVDDGDPVVCYVERADGEKLTEGIL